MQPTSYDALAAQLDLRRALRETCAACLSFVAIPYARGDERTARREARRMAGDLWCDGLAAPALDALRAARDARLAGAAEALEELERLGWRSRVAHAIVLRLAAELERETRSAERAMEAVRDRLSQADPGLN